MFETPDQRAEMLRDALAVASARLRTSIITLVSVSLYLCVAVLATTDADLLLGRTYHLPIADVDLPVKGFYLLAPLIYFILHLALLTQLVQAARRLASFAEAVDEAQPGRELPAPRRLLLLALNAPLSLVREPASGAFPSRRGGLRATSRLLAIIPVAIVPLAILALFHFRFLAYQSTIVSSVQIGLMLLDAVCIVVVLDQLRRPLETTLRRSAAADNATIRRLRRPWALVQVTSVGLVVVYALFSTFSPVLMPDWRRIDLSRQAAGRMAGEDRAVTLDANLLADRLSFVREIDARTFGPEEVALIQREVIKFPAPIDLRDRNLCRARLVGARLARADFSNADLTDANLQNSDLRGAVLRKTTLHRASLSYARLEMADLTDAKMRDAEAPFARFEGAIVHNADLSRANLQGAHLQFLRYDDLGPANENPTGTLKPPVLAGADLSMAQMQGTDFTRLDLRAANLENAQLHGVAIEQAEKEDASFKGAVRSSRGPPWVVHRSSPWGEMIGESCADPPDFSLIYYDAAVVMGEATWRWIKEHVQLFRKLEESCALRDIQPEGDRAGTMLTPPT